MGVFLFRKFKLMGVSTSFNAAVRVCALTIRGLCHRVSVKKR